MSRSGAKLAVAFAALLVLASIAARGARANCKSSWDEGGFGAEFAAGPWDASRNQKLIDLLIDSGIDFRRGDRVVVTGPEYQRPFIELLGEELRRRGAGDVQIAYRPTQAEVAAAIARKEGANAFAQRLMPSALVHKLVADRYSSIEVLGSNELGPPPNVDPTDSVRYLAAYGFASVRYARLVGSDLVPWTMVELPTPLQAKLVAPELSAVDALETLKGMAADVLGLNDPDPKTRWKEIAENIEARGERLSALGIRQLHYTGPGTDLRVDIHPRGRWSGGRLRQPGRLFQPNFPTFESFVSPMYKTTQGRVQVTRAVEVMKTLVRGAWFVFDQGSVVEYGADEGRGALDQFFAQDPRNRYLGEIALVDHDSPVNRQQRPFYSIIYDENALSHIALGSSYPHTFTKPHPTSAAEFESLQLNHPGTLGHTDFMIGGPHLSIEAETYSGRTIRIMDSGRLVF